MRLNIIDVDYPLTFLIDTGADISLCKEKFLYRYEENPDEYCNLTGISREVIKSFGSTKVKIDINGMVIEHSIQLVSNDIPLSTDGILGRDFLSKYKCNVDYDRYILTFNLNSENITIPIHDSSFKIIQVVVPKRSEIILPLTINLCERCVFS